MTDRKDRPEWFDEENEDGFASFVRKGVEGGHDGLAGDGQSNHTGRNDTNRRPQLTVDQHVEGVLAGDRGVLARTITLIESSAPAHTEHAQEVLKRLLPHTGKSIRIGITGVPGAGKSTFIDALGCYLTEREHKVAVMAVDPSSSLSRGSILGDKTRMERLSRDPNAFIRPSPSGGTLGGVTRKSRETVLVCEAAGFDVILIETVGVGQSEITVRSMVDFFLLLMITGAGDELQGLKRGIMEIADALVVNKADGANKVQAESLAGEYDRILHYLMPATEGWITRGSSCSSTTGEGIDRVWHTIETFRELTTKSGVFEKRRSSQRRDWMYAMVEERLAGLFGRHPGVKQLLPEMERAVMEGTIPTTTAVARLLEKFEE